MTSATAISLGFGRTYCGTCEEVEQQLGAADDDHGDQRRWPAPRRIDLMPGPEVEGRHVGDADIAAAGADLDLNSGIASVSLTVSSLRRLRRLGRLRRKRLCCVADDFHLDRRW